MCAKAQGKQEQVMSFSKAGRESGGKFKTRVLKRIRSGWASVPVWTVWGILAGNKGGCGEGEG